MRGNVLVAELDADHVDWWWRYGRIRRCPAFEAVAPLFAEELALLEANLVDEDRFGAIWIQINAELQLIAPDGTPALEFMLHVDGDKASWRAEFHAD